MEGTGDVVGRVVVIRESRRIRQSLSAEDDTLYCSVYEPIPIYVFACRVCLEGLPTFGGRVELGVVYVIGESPSYKA